MPVSRKRAKVKGKSINNRNYPIVITEFAGSFSKVTKRIQKIICTDGSTKEIEHCIVLR